MDPGPPVPARARNGGVVSTRRPFVRRPGKENEMRKLILRMALTVDGVAVVEGDPTDVFDHTDEGNWSDLFATIETVDAMLLGACMHQDYLNHWQGALTHPS